LPDVLVGGRAGGCAARAGHGPAGRAGRVDHFIACDGAEVAVGVGLAGDADEDRLAVGGCGLDAQ